MQRRTAFTEVRHIADMLFPEFEEKDKLEDGVLYVVDGAQHDQIVQYNCPCGCGRPVMIPYYVEAQQKELFPSWALKESDGEVTLSPSVFSTGFPCKSHYFIRNNRIVWC